MMPVLYPETETAFDSNGIGILGDAISAPVVQELNGMYELTLKYPCTGIHAECISDRCIVMAKPDPVTDPQPFRIYRINPASKGIITAHARHLAYDTMGIPAAPFSAASVSEAMSKIGANAVVDCPFSFSTDKSTGVSMVSSVPKSIWNLLGGSAGSVLDVYGGEYEFNRYNIHLHNQRGFDRGVSIRYGKNLKTLEQDMNCANCYTGVYPYWADPDGDLVQLPERIISAPGIYEYVRILTLDLTAEFPEKPSEEQLREYAGKYIATRDIGVPEVSWKVQFVQLEQTEEYKGTALLERVLLGDTVSVIFPDMNVNATARAVKIEFDSILERYKSVTLGKVKSNLADTIVKQQQEIKKKPTASLMQNIASSLTAAITGARGGCVRQLDTNGDGMPDELYIADNPDPSLAERVWRFNYEGLAASMTGYNGPFIAGATFDDGLLAHMVKAANLVAGTIQSADGGKTVFIDLDNGIVNLQPINDEIDGIKTYFRFDADGQYIGRADDEVILRLSAGIIDVLVAGYATATFDRTGMTAEQANIKTLHMGEYTLDLGNDGHLTLS